MKNNKLIMMVLVMLTFLQGCHSCHKKHHAKGDNPFGRKPAMIKIAHAKPQDTTVHFSFDSAEINANMDQTVTQAAQYLKDESKIYVLLEGHTDLKGSFTYNDRLGERRAKAIAKALENEGVPAEKIKLKTYGKRQPLSTLMSKEAQAVNRRVIMHFETKTMNA